MDILARSLEQNFWYCLIRVRDNESFPSAIAQEMSAHGLTVLDISRALNTNTIQIQRWLNGGNHATRTKDGQIL